ncbi:MAG: hypothetical protein WCR67_01995 [Bacilli bacterium]
MRDLKHLYYFEKLLENSHNELIQEAQDNGRLAIGHVCYQIPKPLLNLPGCFSVRIRAPRTGSIEMGSYYLTLFSVKPAVPYWKELSKEDFPSLTASLLQKPVP